MGRKIPGKKHRGVKDPLQQLAKRNESLKQKINAPPENPYDQEIPNSVFELKRLRQMVKDGKFDKNRPRKKVNKKLIDTSKFCNPGPKLPGMVQKDKLFPKFQQKYGEPEESFLNRVYSATEDFIKEATIEKKFNLTVNKNHDGSFVQTDKETNKHCNKKKKNQISLNETSNGKVNRKQKLRFKKEKKKKEFEQDAQDFKIDNVKFGEVVHAPPNLHVRPKGAILLDSDKPGQRDLLLNGLFNSSGIKKGKLSTTEQQKEKRREDVIKAYRLLKLNQLKSNKKEIKTLK